MEIKAYGKINLSLDITGVLENGYHSVAMIMQSVELCDKVFIEKNSTQRITVVTDNPKIPDGKDNLAYKAADLMVNTYNLPYCFDIKIEKNIPLSGGMAGGSTDAAAVMRGINELCDLNASNEDLMKLGVILGADIPFCIQKNPAFAQGIGEKLTPITGLLRDTYILLVNPNIEISTKQIYNLIDTKKCYNTVDNETLIRALENRDLDTASKNMKNVMQMVTAELCPEISIIIETLNNNDAKVALMSGSGATCFGVFKDRKTAEIAQNAFNNTNYFTAITNPIE